MSLEDNIFLKAFTEKGRQQLVSVAARKAFKDGEWLFQEDDPSEAAYLLASGKVELTKRTRHDEVQVIATVEPPGYFGEMGVFDGSVRSAGARSAGEVEVFVIPAAPITNVLKSEPPETTLFFLSRIAGHLRSTNERFIEELLRKERLQVVGEMARTIIHDFKNPMTSIQLAAEIMASQNRNEVTGNCCKMIESQIARMITMAQEILDYSQGRSQLNKERVSLRDLFEETEKLNAAYMEKNCIDYVFDPVDAVVEIDRTRITRVLQNLLSNAVEAMNGRGGRIVFRALLPAPGMVELRIEDNGPGIPEKIRDKLFEPFVTSGKRQGTGLGMAIAKSIVEGHGGTIGFTTETGSGTVFAIRLPTA